MTSEVFDELVIRVENGKKMFRVQAKELPDWYGISDIGLICHNEWSNAEIEYKGEVFNVHDVEDTLWDEYNDDCDNLGVDATEAGFKVYMSNHVNEVYNRLNDLISERKEMKRI